VKVVRTVSEEDLTRLKQARHDADRRYNEALTALDAALQSLPGLPAPPPSPDETQITPLNERWEITRALPPLPTGWRGRLAALAIGVIRPALDQQQAFNAALVDHLNRNAPQQRAVPAALAATVDAARLQFERLVTFQSHLIVFLQQITPYADTKDYEFHALATRVTEDVAESHDALARTVRGLAAALSGVSDEVLKRWERYEGLRASVSTLQLMMHAVKREMTAVRISPALPSVPDAGHVSASPSAASSALSSDPLSSYKYLAFEDLFRGDRSAIRARQADYVALFDGRSDVLDVGCGRGEFLQLLAERGIAARGVDMNHEMVQTCLRAGLDVAETDALSYLRRLPDNALGGLIAAQVVEHLSPDYLLAFLDDAFRVLRPGSPLVLETINVASWTAFSSSYLRDLTHVQPLHPETLRFVVTASGFGDADVQMRSPVPDEHRLTMAPPSARETDLGGARPEARAITALADAFDRNVGLLNAHLYAPLDYAVVAWKR
jgi:SAM-dependent methyltransferase